MITIKNENSLFYIMGFLFYIIVERRNTTEQELVEYLRINIYKIEDQLLFKGKIILDRKANIIVKTEYYQDVDVIIYQLLSNIKAGFKYKNQRIYREVKNQYTEEYIRALINKMMIN